MRTSMECAPKNRIVCEELKSHDRQLAMIPQISIVMPVWNGEKYLRETLDSVLLRQNFRDFEFIVVDDGSTDQTPAMLRSYNDDRLRVHSVSHGGIVHALNFGVAQAQSRWIVRQDADDISFPARMGTLAQAAARKPDAVLIYSDVEPFGENAPVTAHPRLARSRALLALKLCFHSPFAHSLVMFEKQAFQRASGYLPEERHAEDFGLWGRLIETGPLLAIPRKLLRLRIHSESVSATKADVQAALARQISVRHCRRFLNLDASDALRAYNPSCARCRGRGSGPNGAGSSPVVCRALAGKASRWWLGWRLNPFADCFDPLLTLTHFRPLNATRSKVRFKPWPLEAILILVIADRTPKVRSR